MDHGLCSENKELFVQNRVCDKIKPCPRDGGMTDWEDWSACDANCGKGNQTSQRFCANPAPAFGGKNCDGELERRRVCDSGKPCPSKISDLSVFCITLSYLKEAKRGSHLLFRICGRFSNFLRKSHYGGLCEACGANSLRSL